MKTFLRAAAPILLAALLVPAPAGAAGPRLQRCDLGLPRPFQCGHVVAPIRRADPALGTTKVAFAVRTRADRRRPSLGTIVAMDGGPGYASTDAPFARSLVAVLAPLLRRHDLVLFDERGTGRSDVVDCAPLQRGLTPEAIAVGECANQLGPRYAGYTTAEAAHDLEAVRSALGLGKVFFYGDSYGTLFGQAYAVRYPGSLRGLVLDSAYPGDDPYYRTLLPAGLNGLRVACRRAPTCAGDPVARFARVVHRFHAAERSTDDLLDFLLQAGTLAPRSYLSLDAGRPPLPRRRAAAAGAADRARARPATARSPNSPTASKSPSPATTTRCSGIRTPRSTSASASSRPRSPACRRTTSPRSGAASTCSPRPPT